MTILHIAKMTGVAGTENHLLALLPGLHNKGLDIRLIVLVEPGKPMDAYIAQMNALGVPTEALPIARDFDIGLVGALSKKCHGAEIVHTHLIHADVHGLFAAKLAGVRKLVSSGHNDDKFRRSLLIRVFQGWFWRQVNAGIAISEALRQFMITFEFAPPAKIHTVLYGLDPDSVPIDLQAREKLRSQLHLPPDTPIIGSVCRLIEQKGLSYALQAMVRLREALPNLHYVIAGDGPLRDSLEAETAALKLTDRVHFLGWHENGRVLMQAYDALLIPSLWEGFGLVAIEAMCARLPVIASRVSALPEIVAEGETGYLVAPGDVAGLVSAIQRLYAADRVKLGENGRMRLETNFSVARMIARTIAVYEGIQ
jgi:glycosyltransferase involved in cell wall biosynthesis